MMSNSAELASRSLAERLQAMEVLWDSLCREPVYNPAPDWHAEVLAERRVELENADYRPWSDAKKDLLKR